jgi:hypothetical protein
MTMTITRPRSSRSSRVAFGSLALVAVALLGAGCSDSAAPEDDNPTPSDDAGSRSDARIDPQNSDTDPGLAEAGASGNDASPAGTLKPKCMQKDSQLIVIGDSYINWMSHTFPEDIKRVSGQSWRMEAVGGFSMASGGLGSIPPEFYNSIARDPDAHTILMDGGGNDILLPDLTRALPLECTSKGASAKANCQGIVQLALDKAKGLMSDAADKGIRDVVYFFYPHVPANTILSGSDPAEILDYTLPMVRDLCADAVNVTSGRLRCTLVDLVPLFEGHNDWYNGDIHENATGSAAMADYIWKIMTDKCIGQKGPQACCEM